jgi:hypothetical protein
LAEIKVIERWRRGYGYGENASQIVLSLSKLTEEASNFTSYIYRMREALQKKNKRVTFCGSLDHQGASNNLIITLRGEG